MNTDPTRIGTVQDVAGATITVELSQETATGVSFVDGECYRIGQIGGFVRIPLGFINLYGLISQVGAGAAPTNELQDQPFGKRWIKVQLVGEGKHNGHFERGLSQYPTIDDPVHIVTEADLRLIYGPGEPDDFVEIGHLASAESIPALIDVNKLVTRHSAIVGTTGSGKSTTVAGLLMALSDPKRYPASRVILLDLHGEYARALAERSNIFNVATETDNALPLQIPYWALNCDELIKLAFGSLDGQKAASIADMILELKRDTLTRYPREGVFGLTVTADSPVPFSIHKFWFDLHIRENFTFIPKPGGAADEIEPAYVLDANGNPKQRGDAMTVTPPLYRNIKTTGPANERVQTGKDGLSMKQQAAMLASRLRDPKLSFIFGKNDWLPDLDGKTNKDLDSFLENWIGGINPITILDLSGIPSSILNDLIGALLRIIYDAVFWSRNLPEGGRERPLLVVLEEAHAYLNKENVGGAATAVRRIAKEGRKYGVGLMLVSQRPSEIDSTILSQCGTVFALRLSNELDRGQITSTASDNLKGLFELLPTLRTGEAIVVGEAVSLPIRTLIDAPPRNRRPDSVDPRVAVRGSISADGFSGPGGWNQRRDKQDFTIVVNQWRQQTPKYTHKTLV